MMTKTILIPPLCTFTVMFQVDEKFIPRRIAVKVSNRRFEVMIVDVRHMVHGCVEITLMNRSTFDRACQLGLSDQEKDNDYESHE